MSWLTLIHGEIERRLGTPCNAKTVASANEILRDHKEDQQIVYPLAWVWADASPGNPWHRNPALLQAVKVVANDLFASEKISRRLPYPLFQSYRLVKDALGGEAAVWKRECQRVFRINTYEPLKKRERLTQFTSANVGYGTNHLSVEIAGLAAYVQVFRNDTDFEQMQPGGSDLIRFASEFLARFMAYMDPDGYWPESDGPANSYNSLTAASTLRAADALGEVERYRRHFQQASRFSALTTLPNLKSTDVTDGRNHLRPIVGIRKSVNAFTPEGKAVRQEVLEAYERLSEAGERHHGETLHEMLCNHLFTKYESPEPAAQIWNRKAVTERFEKGFYFLRRGAWITVASSCPFRPRPEGHWNLDYQNLWMLYHDRFGTAVLGANGKNDPEAASFCKFLSPAEGMVVRDPETLHAYVPGRAHFEARANGFSLMRDYRGFEGILNLCFKGDEEAVLNINVNARDEVYPVWFTMLPPLRYGQAFTDGTGHKRTVGKDPFSLSGAQLGGAITLQPEIRPNFWKSAPRQPLTIHMPNHAELIWPYAMWDTYNLKTDRYEAIEDQIVRLRIPIDSEGADLRFVLADLA